VTFGRSKLLPLLAMLLLAGGSLHLSPVGASPVDSDHDGIYDAVEGTVDTDADGRPDYLDTDSDNDGIPDGVEGLADPDADGTPAYRDVDSDADTTPDHVEAGANAASPVDTDGDKVPDYLDADSDGDVIPDRVEVRPPPVEAKDVDADEDGVPDDVDQCPTQPGPKSNHGCPPPDLDKDGVPDVDDRCPDKPGVKENQGCPDFDSDGDGYVDRLDKCPFEPETWNGVDDDDGCPDQPAALAAVVGDHIVIFEPVLFERDGSVVDKRSTKLLGIVGKILNLRADILKLRIEGHMDNKMPPLEGLELSRARAAAVRRWLIDNGKVDPKRLTAQGFGSDRPIADNRDFIGRAKNRRIEFVIMQKLDQGP